MHLARLDEAHRATSRGADVVRATEQFDLVGDEGGHGLNVAPRDARSAQNEQFGSIWCGGTVHGFCAAASIAKAPMHPLTTAIERRTCKSTQTYRRIFLFLLGAA